MEIEFFGDVYEFFEENELEKVKQDIKKREELIREIGEYIANSKFKQYLYAEIKIYEWSLYVRIVERGVAHLLMEDDDGRDVIVGSVAWEQRG